MTLIEQILEWAKEQQKWQQKAVGLLLAKEELDEDDIAVLVALCKTESGALDGAEMPVVEALTIEAIVAPVGKGKVTLQAISGVTNVNALTQDANITFGEGLTIVYGDNASGKSGFCRILKNVCRARHPEEILPNMRVASASVPAATVEFSIDGVGQQPIVWQRGDGQMLPSVSVFDAKCATIYVEDENDVAYRPFGLDIFDRLATVCRRMDTIMEEEIRQMEALLDDFSETAHETTKAGKLLSTLSAETKPDDVTTLATLSEDDVAAIALLKKQEARLAEQDPEKKKRALTALKARISRLPAHLKNLAEVLSAEQVETLKFLKKEAEDTGAAAKLATEKAFQGTLPGVGEDAWKKLWEAARAYSAYAYPGQDFPVTDGNAVCVACQQPLSDEAKTRLLSFEAFVKMEAQRAATEAAKAYEHARTVIVSAQIGPADWENVSEEIESHIVTAVEGFLTAAWERKAHIQAALRNGDWTSIPTLQPTPVTMLDALVTAITEEIDALRPPDPVEVVKVKAELAELTARQELQKALAKVIRHITRLVELQKLKACMKKTNTQLISRQSTKLTKTAITQPLYDIFQRELKSIGLPLGAEFTYSKSERGVPFHQIVLKGHDGSPVRLQDIASESEHRGLAISGFFTELATAEHASAIIFDDPVSSLDHVRRDVIAKRIVKEAAGRQVIVFTHDIVFVMALKEWANREGLEPTHRHIRGETQGFGVCYNDLPWSAKNVGARIGELRVKVQAAKVVLSKQGREMYEALGQNIYGLLREAWERGIEEVLLHGTVERFRRGVETKRLRQVEIQLSDYDAVEEGMDKCSMWMAGHDSAPAIGAPFPEPDELLADINALDVWVAAVRSRREKKKAPTAPTIEAAMAATQEKH